MPNRFAPCLTYIVVLSPWFRSTPSVDGVQGGSAAKEAAGREATLAALADERRAGRAREEVRLLLAGTLLLADALLLKFAPPRRKLAAPCMGTIPSQKKNAAS